MKSKQNNDELCGSPGLFTNDRPFGNGCLIGMAVTETAGIRVFVLFLGVYI